MTELLKKFAQNSKKDLVAGVNVRKKIDLKPFDKSY